MITTHVFIAVSLDGYIARQDGDIGWLLQRDDPTEDHGYDAFIADKDWIVMGRGSYEKVLTCTIPEHTHTLECLADITADVETPADWDEQSEGVSSFWSDAMTEIAQRQLGYTESAENFTVDKALGEKKKAWTIDEVPIATIYLAGNESSHFRPLVDSLRIYLPLLAFSASSLVAFGVDFVTLLLLNALTGNLLAAVIGARGLSSAVNFLTNRRMVFGSQRPLRATLVRYYLLVAVLLLANYGLLAWLTSFGVALAVAKVLVEVTLFVASYQVQRSFVFGRPATSRIAPTEEGRQLVSSR